MSGGLAWAVVVAWSAGALIVTPAAAWLRLRDGRLDAGVLVLVVFLAAQLGGLGWIATHGAGALLDREAGEGVPPWLGWMLGVTGLIALATGVNPVPRADRAAALAFGFFGLGHLLRELALAAAG